MFRKPRKPEPTGQPEVVGGLSFFIALLSLITLALLGTMLLPALIDPESYGRAVLFLASAAAGAIIGKLLLSGRLAVFVHELKHSIFSNLVGNKAKSLVVHDESGHFQYQYSKATAHFNAFIALAPYWLPVFTVLAIPFSYLLFPKLLLPRVAFVGFWYGVDLFHSLRDVSPHQSDLTQIRGGFSIALLYVVAINVFVACLVSAWALKELVGLKLLGSGLWLLVKSVVTLIRH